MIRRRTFWFRLTAWGFGPLGCRPGDVLGVQRAASEKTLLLKQTTRGYWGEWW